jgi:DNA-directed RNA polymerase subunit M/transcription elongation factor TFIIS
MGPFDKNNFELMDKYDNLNMEKIAVLHLNNGTRFTQDDGDRNSDDDNDDKADINSKEKENIKDLQQYQQYQESLQHQQSLASSSDISIVEPDKVPEPDPITDAVECPKCRNRQAFWWIVQTDSADEPSTQFFRCTKCNHTWRNPKTS